MVTVAAVGANVALVYALHGLQRENKISRPTYFPTVRQLTSEIQHHDYGHRCRPNFLVMCSKVEDPMLFGSCYDSREVIDKVKNDMPYTRIVVIQSNHDDDIRTELIQKLDIQ